MSRYSYLSGSSEVNLRIEVGDSKALIIRNASMDNCMYFLGLVDCRVHAKKSVGGGQKGGSARK